MFNDHTMNELYTFQITVTVMRYISSCLQSLISLWLQIAKSKVRVQTSQKDTEQVH